MSLNLHEPSSGSNILRGLLFLLVFGGAGEDGYNFLVGPSSSIGWIERSLLGLLINTLVATVFDEFMSENNRASLRNEHRPVERLKNKRV